MTEKSAAREACFPSFPTIPTPETTNQLEFKKGLLQLTDVCGLDHADIVSAVAYAANSFLGVLADQTGDVGFLSRRASTCDYSGELSGDFDKLFHEQIETQLLKASNEILIRK